MSDLYINQRYRLHHVLGVGRLGKVWEAEDTRTGQRVAIKEIRPTVVGDPQEIHHFQAQTNALRVLNHPNLLNVLACFVENHKYYLVTPFAVGGALSERLAAAPRGLPLETVYRVGLGIAQGLKEAHQADIVHGDIRPENILFDAEDKPMLADFGFNRHKSETDVTQLSFVMGVLPYVSPEECDGLPGSTRSDIWRLGVVFYAMLVGRTPFARANLKETVHAILNKPVPSLEKLRSNIPLEMVYLVNAMLQKDPKARLMTARQVVKALQYMPDDFISPAKTDHDPLGESFAQGKR